MSSFQVPVKRISAIEAHPNADAIEFAVVDGYRSIVRKGDFASGELVAYIPEASIVPERSSVASVCGMRRRARASSPARRETGFRRSSSGGRSVRASAIRSFRSATCG